MFKGLGTTLVRESPSYGGILDFNVAYFASYEAFCRMLPDTEPQSTAGLLLAGGFAGIIGWCVTYPVDVIKTRIQSSMLIVNLVQEDKTPKYKNLRHGFKIILREEGYRVFLSGLGATCIRAFPTNAATFYVVATVRDHLEGRYL
jgi:solute carrier family 25 carnitine/acylcarnitine transporter 20/29